MQCQELAVGQCQEHTEMTPESLEIPVTEGARSLEPDLQRDRREQAITATSGKYAEAFEDGYLVTLREDWPA